MDEREQQEAAHVEQQLEAEQQAQAEQQAAAEAAQAEQAQADEAAASEMPKEGEGSGASEDPKVQEVGLLVTLSDAELLAAEPKIREYLKTMSVRQVAKAIQDEYRPA